MTRVRLAATAHAIISAVCASVTGAGAQQSHPTWTDADIRGAWASEVYALADGTRHTVHGRIFFTDSEWQVLFFVMEEDEPRRGSGEGGTYTLDGDRLVLTHFFNLSAGEAMAGLPESPLRMEVRPGDGPTEPTRIRIAGDRMTLFFPSGNSMEFRRSSGSP
jgi:hypothetical protein